MCLAISAHPGNSGIVLPVRRLLIGDQGNLIILRQPTQIRDYLALPERFEETISSEV